MSNSSFIPSFEEGAPRRFNNATLPQVIGAAGEVNHPSVQGLSDLPGRADSKVALHLLDRRGRPPSKEGIKNRVFTWVVLPALFLLMAVPSSAQTYTHRGFLEGRGTLYPLKAVNDSAHTVGEALFRYEGFFTASPTLQLAGTVDLRTDTHHQVERDFKVSLLDRKIQRPLGALRRFSATVHRGPVTFELGKQFIRWGKTDIVTPTDRFAPRDFLTVVDNEFLAVTAARLNFEKGANTVEAVWSPRFTPSRVPLAGQRWAPPLPQLTVPVGIRSTRRSFPGGAQSGIRWNHTGPVEFGVSLYQGFNHLPSFDVTPQLDVELFYPNMTMVGLEFAIPAPLFIVKGEAAQFNSSDSRADEYGLYVLQLEKQAGEWFFIGGYAGEAITKRGSRTATFAPDRGLTQTFLGRAGYTLDANRSVAFEAAVRQNGDGFWAKAEYSQAFGQHWRLTLNVTGIAGEISDFLGQYRRNSHSLLIVRYSF